MSVTVQSESATIAEAVEVLMERLPASKVARLLASWQMGQGDYLKLREELFVNWHRSITENPLDIHLLQFATVQYNHIGRAYGILASAHRISSKETMNLLSLMRLGVDPGLFTGTKRSLVDELFIVTQRAHLQKSFSEKLSAEERDLLRADMLGDRLRGVSRPNPLLPPDGSKLDKPG